MDICLQIEQLQAALAAAAAQSQKLNAKAECADTAPPILSSINQYESVFRIDGVPILPPLLTAERRKEMQEHKAHAVKLEKQLAERRNLRVHFNESQLSRSADQRQQKQLHQQDDVLMARLKKLQISETIFTDNTEQNVQTPVAAKTSINNSSLETPGDQQITPPKWLQHTPKPRHLLLKKCSSEIPDICVYPPTPQVPQRTMADSLKTVQVAETSINVDRSNKQVNPFSTSEMSSEDSLPYDNANFMDLEMYRQIAKEKYERTKHNHQQHQICSDTNMVTHSSYMDSPRRHSLEDDMERSVARLMVEDVETGCIVRSNSFTLDRPSEALLTHIRQQRDLTKVQQTSARSSALRDTIESRAKKVPKASIKSRQSVALSKSQSSSLTNSNLNNLNAPTTQYNSSQSQLLKVKRSSPYESKVYNNNHRATEQPKRCSSSTGIIKTVKSKTSSGCKSNFAKSSNTTVTTAANSTSNNINNSNNSSGSKRNICKEYGSDMEEDHRRKFLKLLEAQQMEQQRMQAAFEAQQQMLLQQLNPQLLARNDASGSDAVSNNSRSNRSPNSPYIERLYGLRNSGQLNSATNRRLDYGNLISPGLNMSLEMPNSPTPTMLQPSDRSTPRRRLFLNNDMPQQLQQSSVGSAGSPQSQYSQQQLQYQKRQHQHQRQQEQENNNHETSHLSNRRVSFQ